MIYFDNAATTYPKPDIVYTAVTDYMRNHAGNPGRGSHPLALAAAETVYGTRRLLAELFSADTENVIFTMNATYALNTALYSIIERNDHILISNYEHNSVLRPVEFAAQSIPGVSYDIFDVGDTADKTLASIDSKRHQNTKVLIAAHTSNIIKSKLPIREVGAYCREHNIIFITDCAQSAGHDDIDIIQNNIDIICIPGHKGLYGIQGCGAIIFGDTDISRYRQFISGGSGTDSIPPHMPEYTPDKYEAGTFPVPAIAALGAGIKWLNGIGIKRIAERENAVCSYILKEFQRNKRIKLYSIISGSTILFNVEGKQPSEVSSFLSEHGICVRSGLHCAPLAHKSVGTYPGGAVRASFGYFNTKKEADIFIETVNYYSGH